ncbi:hypothetical protein BDN67DRAFT_985336 [Paxillus ammoniavirescens]|nr:hypothetical protein BDN67DRAFT_985336 [Paxillus ammoniavirescens]
MSSRNYVLARIMHMGDHVMVELSIDPDLLGFNLVAKILGQGKVVHMRMEDMKLIARGEVLYTGMVVEWETHEMTGAPQWRSLFADELVELKGSMELVWGETKEGTVLLNPELVFRVRRQNPVPKLHEIKGTRLGPEVSSVSFANIPPNVPNQSRLVQIYMASEPKKSSFALGITPVPSIAHAIAPPLLGGHALLPTASVESTDEWRCEWEIWMGALLRVLGNAKEEGDWLEIPYDVVQAIATAEAAYTNLESQAEADRA